MGVDEAGHQRAAAEVDDARALRGARRGRRRRARSRRPRPARPRRRAPARRCRRTAARSSATGVRTPAAGRRAARPAAAVDACGRPVEAVTRAWRGTRAATRRRARARGLRRSGRPGCASRRAGYIREVGTHIVIAASTVPCSLTIGTDAVYSPAAVSSWFSAKPSARTRARISCSSPTVRSRRPVGVTSARPPNSAATASDAPAGEDHTPARGRERRRAAADPGLQAHGLRRLLDRDEDRLVAVDDREADGLVVAAS